MNEVQVYKHESSATLPARHMGHEVLLKPAPVSICDAFAATAYLVLNTTVFNLQHAHEGLLYRLYIGLSELCGVCVATHGIRKCCIVVQYCRT